MTATTSPQPSKRIQPVLLFDDECSVCRHIASWVQRSTGTRDGEPTLIVQAIGEDPKVLERLSPGLSIWDAYATIHVVMPDGSLKLGGEAVAEVFRTLPPTQWLAQSFSIRILGVRPFQKILDLAYVILADIRPILGCESCGTPTVWVKPIYKTVNWIKAMFGAHAGKPRSVTPLKKA